MLPLCAALLGLFLGTRTAEAQQASEQDLKAAFLFNFVKFIEFPADAFESASAPFVLGVIGDDGLARALEIAVSGKAVAGRGFEVKRFASGQRLESSHVLLFGRTEKRTPAEALAGVGGKAVLTVGDEVDRFCEQGGMIVFFKEDKKVRFEINNAALERAGLRASSKLLRLAAPARSSQ